MLRPVDFSVKARYFTLDAIANVAFGEPLGDLDHDEDHLSYIKAMDRFTPAVTITCLFPSLIALVRIIRLPLIRKIIPSDPGALGLGEVMRSVIHMSRSIFYTKDGFLMFSDMQVE